MQKIRDIHSKEADRYANRKVGHHPESLPAQTSTAKHYRIGFAAGADFEYKRKKWVSVKDSLPPKGLPVLVRPNNGLLFTDYIGPDGDWYEYPERCITEWCEIPN